MGRAVLFGDDCVPNILYLNELYQNNRIDYLSKIRIDGRFHGILGNIELISKVDQFFLTQCLTRLGNKNWDTKEYYETLLRLYIDFGAGEIFFPGLKDIKPISYSEFLAHRNEIMEAIDLLKVGCPWMHNLFYQVIGDVWFLSRKNETRFVGGGGSDYSTIGLMTMSLRPDSELKVVQLTIALAHELGHNCLFLLQAGQNPIVESFWNKKILSGIRKVERPAYASLHAAVALGYMIDIAVGLYKSPAGHNKIIQDYLLREAIEYASDLRTGINALRNIKFNPIGKVVVFELEELLNRFENVLVKLN